MLVWEAASVLGAHRQPPTVDEPVTVDPAVEAGRRQFGKMRPGMVPMG